MITVCTHDFIPTDEYTELFSNYPFELSNFQKHAIKGIRDSKHVLITAHTGSGKTLPAEYAIKYFTDKGKKIVYTSPIKALSNQKFYEFTKMFPNISFGLLTGDIKTNPEADVLIMTTEILRNTLFQKKMINEIPSDIKPTEIPLTFDMDIENELGCVIFDEIHYINDADRGKVWEETIMMTPNHIQLLMLSATLDKQENFAKWISEIKKNEVILCPTSFRVVPLKHYSFVTCPASTFKKHKDKSLVSKFNQIINIPKELKGSNKKFNDLVYHNAHELLNHLKTNNIYIKKQFVLNETIKYLNNNGMLPAICFIFSRKGVEESANEITISLFENDDATPNIIADECQKILMKLPNYKEYINLPEYTNLIKILKKGIAIHHSGIMPIFREMVELIFSKGYIKLLFATETFAVGINMPTKTVIFTSLTKFDGSYNRALLSHEYTQMSGRAGRRGLDTVGYVFHLNNIFNIPTITDYQFILGGKPQTLISKFKIHYNLILNLLHTKGTPPESSEEMDKQITDRLNGFVDKSMIQNEIQKEFNGTKLQEESIKNKLDKTFSKFEACNTPVNIIEDYVNILDKLELTKAKQRKKVINELDNLKDEYKHLEKDVEVYKEYQEHFYSLQKIQRTMLNIKNYTFDTIHMLMEILYEHNFISYNANNIIVLTTNGFNAAQLQEFHCLAGAELILQHNYFENLSVKQLCALFSCFSNIVVQDDNKFHYKSLKDFQLKEVIINLETLYNKYYDIETLHKLDTGCSYELTFDIINYVMEWCDANSENECKLILEKLASKNIFAGEFVKAILKINNTANELEKIAEINNKIDLLQKLREIPEKTLKFVATNQSLYV